MKISVSMLGTYLYCSRKLFLQQVLALKEPPKESILLGSIRHEIYDYFNKGEERIVSRITKDTVDDITELYKRSYTQKVREIIIKNKSRIREVELNPVQVFRKTWPYILDESETRSNNVLQFVIENDVYGKELWERLTPKILSEIPVSSENLKLKGTVDRIEVYENGYVPVELKTGKIPREGMWPGHRVQIAAYAMLLEEKFNTKVKEGFVNYLDQKQLRQIAINPFMKGEVTKLVGEILELLNRKYLPKYTENRNKCTYCGLREKCYNEEEMEVLMAEVK